MMRITTWIDSLKKILTTSKETETTNIAGETKKPRPGKTRRSSKSAVSREPKNEEVGLEYLDPGETDHPVADENRKLLKSGCPARYGMNYPNTL